MVNLESNVTSKHVGILKLHRVSDFYRPHCVLALRESSYTERQEVERCHPSIDAQSMVSICFHGHRDRVHKR